MEEGEEIRLCQTWCLKSLAQIKSPRHKRRPMPAGDEALGSLVTYHGHLFESE